MEEYACLASDVDCYNVDTIKIAKGATVSQGDYLCTASHNIYSKKHELITAPIVIDSHVWVAAYAFVRMSVTIGEGAVLVLELLYSRILSHGLLLVEILRNLLRNEQLMIK